MIDPKTLAKQVVRDADLGDVSGYTRLRELIEETALAAIEARDRQIHELAAMPNPNNADEMREALNHIYEITKP